MEHVPPVPLAVVGSQTLVLGHLAVVHEPDVDAGHLAQRDVPAADAQHPVDRPGRVDGEGQVDLGAPALAQHDDVGVEVAERVEGLLERWLGRDAGDEDHAGTGWRSSRAA